MARYVANQDEALQHFLRKIEGVVGDRLQAVVLYGPRLDRQNGGETAYNILAILDAVSPDVRSTIEGLATQMQSQHHVPFLVVAFSEEEQRLELRKPHWKKVREDGLVVWPRQQA